SSTPTPTPTDRAAPPPRRHEPDAVGEGRHPALGGEGEGHGSGRDPALGRERTGPPNAHPLADSRIPPAERPHPRPPTAGFLPPNAHPLPTAGFLPPSARTRLLGRRAAVGSRCHTRGMLFARIAETSAAVAATRSRLEKRALLAATLREAETDEIDVVAT